MPIGLRITSPAAEEPLTHLPRGAKHPPGPWHCTRANAGSAIDFRDRTLKVKDSMRDAYCFDMS